ncbi:hypothetical protein HYU16_04880 [Candidatus Woesearchaeota archaeon]|nr:hypothetical protein [Candidatus Woesearchaeota archaeon]
MTLDQIIIRKLSADFTNLRKRYAASEKTQWGWHAYTRRALVIFADRAREAALHQTPENLAKAQSALQQANAVFNSLDQFVRGNGTLAGIGDHLMPLEDSYRRDFPQSRLAAEITSGFYPL